ncbi:M23 family metallopeptidase [Zhouia amylolytica]|uniref:M23 family metallopeptidase n=1 Tax=Zhouia amylolytica TaxID=376730 RepID=UPI0020CBC673|nr:M23 family metallopeptidase [Zhouia amylolytica]MCQ0113036.1 hypothetical protein [Zhouia amylolytica]
MRLHNINTSGKIRECDSHGCGHYGASRGSRMHKGIDFITYDRQPILAPFDCVVNRYGDPYGDGQYKLIEILGVGAYKGYKVKIMYISPLYELNKVIVKGEMLCVADSIAKRYPGITDHVHFEVYFNGKLLDPTKFFKEK